MNTTEHMFDRVHIYGDIATAHRGNAADALRMLQGIAAVGAVPKIQLYSHETWPHDWGYLLEERRSAFVPSVFRPTDLDYILPYEPMALKIASVESTYWELMRLCMQTQLPLLISTGGMDDSEVMQLLEHVEEYSGNVCLMHCVSMYPTPVEEARLHRIGVLSEAMDDMLMVPYVGWSSHHVERVTLKLLPIALTLGADQVEVHVRMHTYMEKHTADDESAVPLEYMSALMDKCRLVADAIGDEEDDSDPPDRDAVLHWRERWQQS